MDMEKDQIAAIFAPTKAQSRGPGRPGAGSIGSGYPVSDELVLTSRHVVDPVGRNPRSPIRVCWYHASAKGCAAKGRWISIKAADVVWRGDGDLDAALIRCPRPESLRQLPLPRLLDRKPRKGEEWEGAGFARADRREGVREPGEFGGKVRTMAAASPYFEVIEDAKPFSEELWKGASGMPVFVDDGILGVVKQVPPNYEGKKLDAVPSWRLLEDPQFRLLLGLGEDDKRLERATAILTDLLNRSERVRSDLAAGLGRLGKSVASDTPGLVRTLLHETPPLDKLFSLAVEVQDRRRAAKDRAGARVAADLILTILPAIYQAADVARLRREKCDGSLCILEVPARLSTLAEILMAAADARPAAYWPPATELDLPEGVAHLPEPPERGRDPDNKQIARDFRQALIETFAEDAGRFAATFREYLKLRFVQGSLRSPAAGLAEGELTAIAATRLRQAAEDPKRPVTYYYIVPYLADPQIRAQREKVLAELKQDFPHIAFLRLGGGERADLEVERLAKLPRLLYDAPEPVA